ncbi:flap endonuclease GEN [Anoplophora glabripennis]|uniref:flap endonuclease GEN n=1 Tax=Anoplophora glabripennis TaxID=217634 RepID=UPI000874AB94|nr:flap endonuclease GEN [Anoplophora glabripennis]
MGIKHLWTILTPFCERKPLYELQRKTVAVDLSCWICEAQNVAEYQVQPRMYLRNLYFRTCYLLLMEVNPVFVLEGKAPELKYQTIAARNDIQFKGAKPKTGGVKTGKDRTRFHFVLKQCEEMLNYMGLVCIKGKGEAESLCAYLNVEGLVDGIISQDSDCFAYGAKVVYRNFSISTQGGYASSGGAVDIYDITKAYKSLNFGRNKIIAMALLCGSDYSEGVLGVGKESVMKLFEKLSDEETLDRLRSWRLNSDMYEEFENKISDKNMCTSCGHNGKLHRHTKNGCNSCGTTKGCDPFKFKDERLSIKNEINMRNKALQDSSFPNETLIKEFLEKKDNVSQLNLKWKQPNVVNFIRFTAKFLQWEEIYSFEKIIPILTRWQCLNYEIIERQTGIMGILYPDQIKKTRNPKGIPSYEIIWSDPEEYFKNLIPEEQLMQPNIDLEKLWSTVEPQNLVDKAYPKLVEIYKQSKIKPKKVSKRKKKDVNIDQITDMMTSTSISEPKLKKSRKKKELGGTNEDPKKSKAKVSKATALDNFLKTAVVNSHKIKSDALKTQKGDIYKTSTPTKLKQSISFDLDVSKFGDEDDLEVSDIIEDIISKKPKYIEENIGKIKLDEFEDDVIRDDVNSSSFFMTNPIENDLFEKTFNDKDESGDDTVEYDLDEFIDEDDDKENKPSEPEKEKNCSSEEDDSFCDKYVPLYERLKKK